MFHMVWEWVYSSSSLCRVTHRAAVHTCTRSLCGDHVVVFDDVQIISSLLLRCIWFKTSVGNHHSMYIYIYVYSGFSPKCLCNSGCLARCWCDCKCYCIQRQSDTPRDYCALLGCQKWHWDSLAATLLLVACLYDTWHQCSWQKVWSHMTIKSSLYIPAPLYYYYSLPVNHDVHAWSMMSSRLAVTINSCSVHNTCSCTYLWMCMFSPSPTLCSVQIATLQELKRTIPLIPGECHGHVWVIFTSCSFWQSLVMRIVVLLSAQVVTDG